ncbi:MAG TPA: DUF1028 domain-containing protein [Candidatus Polarisedimenticolia bacterium]|nr:DUF1028 domain-containing protein [Candidatus Polarisedimenticolia bacterium]
MSRIVLAASLLLALAAGPQGVHERAAARENRSADPSGLLHATFSICAIDAATGESGVAVTTRVPFVGRAVPWVRAGVGAAATQAWTVVEYGRQALDLMEREVAPQEVIERLLADDRGRERRQLGLIDMQGRTAAFTGKETNGWAGSRQGQGYTVQGNILVGREVVDAVAGRFESTAGSGMPLAERLVLALEAGQRAGGDKRLGNLQSAALRVADPRDPGRAGDHISVSIDVGEHPEPVGELKRVYYATSRRLGHRSFSAVEGPDVVELKRLLHAAGYWRKGQPPIPEPPRLDFDRSLLRSDPTRLGALFDEHNARLRDFMAAWGVFDQEAIEAVDAFRKDHALAHEGNPRGLVDAALIEALRRAAPRPARGRGAGRRLYTGR